MVSKSKILGKSSLIFVTVGSTDFRFDRLFSVVDKGLIKQNHNITLVVQSGNSQYNWLYKKIIIYKYLNPLKINSFIKKADKVISHSGFASIYLGIKYAKNNPLFVPRLAKFAEHVDNHQLFFTEFLRNKVPDRLKKYFLLEENIDYNIQNFIKERSKKNTLNKYLFNEFVRKQKAQRIEFHWAF